LPEVKRHVLIAGVSARAAAESAARAGFRVTAIDAFGDLDQHPSVTVHTVPRTFTAHAAARAARGVACDAVAYLSSFENHPTAVAMLIAGRALWGNPADVLQRVRNPRVLSHALRRRGFAVPGVLSREPGTFEPLNPLNLSNPSNLSNPGSPWLVKPLSSGGGRRVRRWRPGTRVPGGCYLQEFIEGVPGSIVFAAAGGRAVPLGFSQQLVGESAFGAAGYQYCGSILTPAGASIAGTSDRPLFDDACALCEAVADEFGLVGVNGIDFVACHGRANAVEVNPRWSASMELVELAYGLSVFGAHAGACADGVLPMFNLSAARRDSGAVGKAIVFARTDTVVGDTRAWLTAPPVQDAMPAVRDIPHRGERIAAGRPVCTVFAAGCDTATCHAALVERAHHVYAALAEWAREVA
jgi:predicted ATP-grasp superfamily ATP-dependent carboligase